MFTIKPQKCFSSLLHFQNVFQNILLPITCFSFWFVSSHLFWGTIKSFFQIDINHVQLFSCHLFLPTSVAIQKLHKCFLSDIISIHISFSLTTFLSRLLNNLLITFLSCYQKLKTFVIFFYKDWYLVSTNATFRDLFFKIYRQQPLPNFYTLISIHFVQF